VGSDAVNRDPDYSAAYCILETDTGVEGHGLTFTLGRGTELCVCAIQYLSQFVRGRKLSSLTTDFAAFSRQLTRDTQFRWLGPEKGVIHLAAAALINAVWDLYARVEGKPLWKLLADLEPEEIVRAVDFTYISDAITPEEEIKDPYVLEFLGLKDEYSESEIEEALILHLERFLLELGADFAFIGRQRRLRIGDEWYRIDLLFFHRKLRCLVVIDLKRGRFTHADAGQMHMYLNYAREHWTHEGENPPVGLILCSQKDEAIARYALDGLPNKILATEYRTVLPDEQLIADEIEKTRQQLEARRSITR